MKPGKKPKNVAESIGYDKLASMGFTVTKRGWPDFFCFNEKTGEIAVVEVKRNKHHKLKDSQSAVMKALSKHGIPCYKFTADNDQLIKIE